MTGADIEKALNGGPTPDDSLKIDFAVSNGTLQVDEGIPPISGMDATGHVTGTKVLVRAPDGLVQMANNRSLTASEGAFVLDNYWDDNGVARIDFRLTGGADGLGRAPAGAAHQGDRRLQHRSRHHEGQDGSARRHRPARSTTFPRSWTCR